MKNKRFFTLLSFVLFVFVSCSNNQDVDYCTQEAKLCADGSYVGRQGPNCEFSACPVLQEQPVSTSTDSNDDSSGSQSLPSYSDNWQTYSNDSLSFKYPADLGSEYIAVQTWPPTITVISGVFSCGTEVQVIDGSSYCLSSESDGAAGSKYVTYSYLKNLESSEGMLKIEFTLRFPQCGNYPSLQKKSCEKDQTNLELDKVVDQIAKTIQLSK